MVCCAQQVEEKRLTHYWCNEEYDTHCITLCFVYLCVSGAWSAWFELLRMDRELLIDCMACPRQMSHKMHATQQLQHRILLARKHLHHAIVIYGVAVWPENDKFHCLNPWRSCMTQKDIWKQVQSSEERYNAYFKSHQSVVGPATFKSRFACISLVGGTPQRLTTPLLGWAAGNLGWDARNLGWVAKNPRKCLF
eukprot:793737-Pelagomonas_calceolata.AAC.5